MDESKIDELFERLYGFKPKKKGASYELLVAAAFKLMFGDAEVRANQYIEGIFSAERYQIDATIGPSRAAIEAKDYTSSDKKVGRPDVTKLAGALQDLPFKSGIVASATDFTRQASSFAESTSFNPSSKPITLYHVRPSTVEDEQGRIRSVSVHVYILGIDHENKRFQPVLTARGNEVLKETYNIGDSITTNVNEFYKADGNLLLTIFELTSRIGREPTLPVPGGSWTPPEPAYIMIGEKLIEISEFRYYLPTRVVTELEFVVEANGEARLLIKSEEEGIDRLLTDIDLKRVVFSGEGEGT